MAGPDLTVVGTDGNDSINLVFQSAGVIGDPTDGHDAINTFGGADIVEAGGGPDQVFLGAGDDFFTWRNGDGDDLVFGDGGHDTFFWRTKSFVLGVEANDDDGVSLTDFNELPELFDIEHLVIFASGNGAVITLGDLSRTTINQVAIDLAGSLDETSGNGKVDTLVLRGSDAGDHITISRTETTIVVDGLPEKVTIEHAETSNDGLLVSGADGSDVIDASRLPANAIELLLSGGFGNDTVIGSAGKDQLLGDEGNDVLAGGAGADALNGASGEGVDTGIDTASYATSGAAVKVSLLAGTGSGGDAAGDTLVDIENLIGSAFADTLTGDARANVLDGLAGNDLLAGGKGADTLNGGDGIDTASYSGSAAAVTINLLAGTAGGGDAAGDKLISIENLTGSAFGDTLTGSASANRLDGGAGDDTMAGGLGNDTYVVDSAGDVVTEAAAGGTDTIFSTVAFTLADNVENLTLIGAPGPNANVPAGGLNGVGNDLANVITGNAFANRLDGGIGGDVLSGGDGVDDLLGGRGLDRLAGGAGNDLLTGGKGRDQFLFDSALGATNVDKIADFRTGKETIILDQTVFSEIAQAGKLKAAFFDIGKKAADGDDHIIYNAKTGKLFYDADGKGGGAQVLFATLHKHLDLHASDFAIVA